MSNQLNHGRGLVRDDLQENHTDFPDFTDWFRWKRSEEYPKRYLTKRFKRLAFSARAYLVKAFHITGIFGLVVRGFYVLWRKAPACDSVGPLTDTAVNHRTPRCRHV